MLHVRFEGRSHDVPLKQLNLTAAMSDAHILSSVADLLEVRRERLSDYVVDRRPNGNLVVCPEAVYG